MFRKLKRLLQQCWNLHVLATSRELLRIPGEASYRVPPLTLPKNNPNQPEAVLACDAAQLFVERTRALNDPSFSLDKDTDAMAIAQICQCLDGIPLALELAASLTRVMALDEVAAHLGNDLSSPTNQQRTAISRHYTMEQALTWSYDLLTSVEQQLLARLSVFSGGWTLEAAREVCGGTAVIPLLDQLVLKSLVILDRRSGTLRYRFLEPIRQFAHAHLLRLQASGELDELRLLHIRYYTKLAEQVSPRMQERPALDNLELEHDNFRAVLSCSLTSDPEPGLRLITALGEYWRIRGHLLEGWRWAQSLLKQGGQTDPTVLAAALASASMLAYHLGQHSQSKHMGREALALARQIGDPALLAWSSHSVGLALSQSVTTEKEHQEAESFFDGALSIFRAQHNTLGIAKSIGSKGEMARLRGDIEGATVAYREALDLFSQLGNSVGMSVSHLNLGWVSQRLGDDLGAEEHFRKSLTLARQIADQDSIINALAGLAALTVKAGELERAAQLIGAIETQQLAYGNPFDATDWADYEPFIVTARTQMALSVFDLRREEGSRLTLEQAIDYALNYPQRTAPSLPDCA